MKKDDETTEEEEDRQKKVPPLTVPRATKQSDESSSGSGGGRNSNRSRSLVLTLDLKEPCGKGAWTNHKAAVADIQARLRRGPSAKDGHGFIYMYEYENDASPRYRKIGRSERLPAKRCAEWPGSKLIKSWRCRRNRLAEVLIHWLLDAVRVYRYVVGINEDFGFEVLVTREKRSKQWVKDANYHLSPGADPKKNTVAGKTRHQEWFMAAHQEQLVKVIETVVSDINFHWQEGEPWSELMEQMK
jgi:hypothetical protein